MTVCDVIRKGAHENEHVPNVVTGKIKRPNDERICEKDIDWNQK